MNKVADALSREFGGQPSLNLLVTTGGVDWAELRQQIQADPFIQQLQKELSEGRTPVHGYTLENGMISYKGRLVIPPKSTMVNQLLHEYHDSNMGGHAGEFKTYKRIANEWYWVGMRKIIAKYVQKCLIFQQQKHLSLRPAGLLQPLPIPSKV